MKKLSLVGLSLALTASLSAQTNAPQRVAVINVRQVLADSNAGKSAYERLKKMQDERAGKIQKMTEELTGLESQLKQKQLSLTDDKVQDLNRQITDRKVSAQRFAQDAERELGEARDKSLAELEKQILPVITEVGKEMGFALIFNKFESGLVYASEAIDITDVVLKRVNSGAAAKTPAKAPVKAPAKPPGK